MCLAPLSPRPPSFPPSMVLCEQEKKGPRFGGWERWRRWCCKRRRNGRNVVKSRGRNLCLMCL